MVVVVSGCAVVVLSVVEGSDWVGSGVLHPIAMAVEMAITARNFFILLILSDEYVIGMQECYHQGCYPSKEC